MDHQEIRDSLAVFALGAVEPGEQAEIEGHMVGCAPCRDEVTNLRHAVAQLSFGSESLREEYQNRLDPRVPKPRSALAPAARDRGRVRAGTRRRLAGTAVLAAGLAVVAVLATRVSNQGREIDQLRTVLEEPAELVFENVLAEPGTTTFALRSTDGAIVLPAAVTADGRGYLDGDALPPLAVDRTYQLWGAIDGRRVSLGLLGADPSLVPFDPRLFTAFAITDELAGGVESSLMTAVVTGSVG